MLGRLRLLLLLACAAVVGGCGGSQSPLAPESKPARDISTLWWWMLAVAGLVFLGAVFMLGTAYLRRREEGAPVIGKSETLFNRLVVLFGILLPIVALAAVFVVANLVVTKDTDAPAAGTTKLTITVVGHQWFWEVRYPGTPAVTANEIHIPARTPVNVQVRTADVIHSFWVPRLNKKVDMIPGRANHLMLYADRPGVYRGQCAEFCGPQHAHMAMAVYADPPATFRAWLANMEKPRVKPATRLARVGEETFLAQGCSGCHTMRGTAARGRIGPDLTHLMSRRTLAALTIPNRRPDLAGWIRDPQHVKPGNRMPGLNLTGPQLQALVAYLETLK